MLQRKLAHYAPDEAKLNYRNAIYLNILFGKSGPSFFLLLLMCNNFLTKVAVMLIPQSWCVNFKDHFQHEIFYTYKNFTKDLSQFIQAK